MHADTSTTTGIRPTGAGHATRITHPHGPAPASPARLAVFLAATLGTTWLAFLPMILGHVERDSTGGFFLLLLGIGAPSITAFVLTALHGGRPAVRELRRGGTRWRVHGGWYLAILAIPGLAFGAGWAVAGATGTPTTINPWVPALISGLLAGLLEEFGWSGFAFPALQTRFGFLRAGAAVGVIVAVWHLPFFLLPGTTQDASSFVMFLLTLVAARIVFGWVYNGSGGSILLAVLLHASGNAISETLGRGPSAEDAASLTEALVFAAAALAAVLITRRQASRPQVHRS